MVELSVLVIFSILFSVELSFLLEALVNYESVVKDAETIAGHVQLAHIADPVETILHEEMENEKGV